VSFVVPLAEAGVGSGPGSGAGSGAAAVGGKGASLGELARAGVAVPPGFVVTVGAFTTAMTVLDPDGALRAEIEALPASGLAEIAAVTARFRALVAGARLPEEVATEIAEAYAGLSGGGGRADAGGADAGGAGAGGAGAGGARADGGVASGVVVGGAATAAGGVVADVAVRSSATVEDSAEASFAGLQDTYLGVSGAGPVLEHVRRCWASLYNDESVAYRRRLGLPEAGVSMAVVVQTMVAPRAAGVMFTRSPVTGDRSVVAIEGTWGLGSALVSGDVTPDSWVISKITGEITTRRISPKVKIHRYIPNGTGVTVSEAPPDLLEAPCLTDDEIRALAALARRVEAHYGAPQDIEWAVLESGEGLAGEGLDAQRPAGQGPAEKRLESGGGIPERIVLLQSRPETVWATRTAAPAGTPKPRAADHVLALFGKPL
jgi:pyruvate,water dikinase